jgi:DNA-binding transcriptional MerR regulator
MLKIGEFSRLSQVSVKALRFYADMGLLRPTHIDDFTGYRYYELKQSASRRHTRRS